jgi:hypothetical protein
MSIHQALYRKTLKTLEIFWELARIIVPITVLTQVLTELGVIRAVSPFLAPVMGIFGLPPELALAWLTGLVVGLWGAVAIVFTLAPASTLTVADMTVFSALILVAHAIPIEQRIIQKAGPGLILTSVLRIAGGIVFAVLLHQLFAATGWLAAPLDPAWTPTAEAEGWVEFAIGTIETLATMFVVLLGLNWVMELLTLAGMLGWLHRALAPLFRLSGLDAQTVPFATIGLLLGISYGGGLLIREARSARIEPRQVFLACVFMGFAHSIIEDTLLVVALGADYVSVCVARLVFAVLATALLAGVLKLITDRTFFAAAFRRQTNQIPQSE